MDTKGAETGCRNVVFMALSADSRPHFTTIASFVSNVEQEIASLFGDVLLRRHGDVTSSMVQPNACDGSSIHPSGKATSEAL
jgi:hypothetical protein